MGCWHLSKHWLGASSLWELNTAENRDLWVKMLRSQTVDEWHQNVQRIIYCYSLCIKYKEFIRERQTSYAHTWKTQQKLLRNRPEDAMGLHTRNHCGPLDTITVHTRPLGSTRDHQMPLARTLETIRYHWLAHYRPSGTIRDHQMPLIHTLDTIRNHYRPSDATHPHTRDHQKPLETIRRH